MKNGEGLFTYKEQSQWSDSALARARVGCGGGIIEATGVAQILPPPESSQQLVLQETISSLVSENNRLSNENKELNEENRDLRKHISELALKVAELATRLIDSRIKEKTLQNSEG